MDQYLVQILLVESVRREGPFPPKQTQYLIRWLSRGGQEFHMDDPY